MEPIFGKRVYFGKEARFQDLYHIANTPYNTHSMLPTICVRAYLDLWTGVENSIV